MVGNLVLKDCLANPQVKEVISISRRSTGIQHEKLTEILHDDMMDLSSIRASFNEVDTALYCLGAYTGAVSKEDLKQITLGFKGRLLIVWTSEFPVWPCSITFVEVFDYNRDLYKVETLSTMTLIV